MYLAPIALDRVGIRVCIDMKRDVGRKLTPALRQRIYQGSLKLKLATDDSGNSAASESLVFGCMSLSFYTPMDEFELDDDLGAMNLGEAPYEIGDAGEVLVESEETIELWSCSYSNTQVVYDKAHSGYAGLAIVVDEGQLALREIIPISRA